MSARIPRLPSTTTATLALALLAAPACVDPAPDDVTTDVAAAAAGSSRWPTEPGHLIRYYIDGDGVAGVLYGGQPGCDHAVPGAGFSTPGDAQDIRAAIARYEAQTPLRFQELSSAPALYPGHPVLVFTRGDYDSAHGDSAPADTAGDFVGCVYLPDGSDLSVGTFQHEIGHDLGLMHEQRRSDRDSAVVYDDACVEPGDEIRYQISPGSLNLSPYDTASIMQYRSRILGTCTQTYDLLRKTCEPWQADCDNRHPSTGCPAGQPGCRIIAVNTDFSAHDRNVLYRMYEPALGVSEDDDALGAAAVAGDFDGDGYDDLAVGAPGEAPYADPATGAVYVYKGTEGGLQGWKVLRPAQLVASSALHAGDRFGTALAARDLDGDGADELVVGAPGFHDGGHASAGAVFVYRGDARLGLQPHATYRQSTLATIGPSAGDELGGAVAIARLDGSRWHLVVGVAGESVSGVSSGYVAVLRAPVGSMTFAFAQGLYPTQAAGTTAHAGDRFGSALATADWNGDGTTDLAVGAPMDTVAGQGGAVFLYRGGATLVSSGRLDDASADAGGRFGAALAAGDFRAELWPSGKPRKRLAVGAPGKHSARGKVYVYQASATAGGFAMSGRQTLDESMANLGMAIEDNDRFGEVLAVADFDRDGKDELAVGAPYEDVGGQVNAGAVAFFHGTSGDLVGWGTRTQQASLWPNLAHDRYGAAIAAGRFGDRLDDPSAANDAWPDLAIGVPGKRAGAIVGPQADDAGGFQALMGDGTIPDYVWTFTQDFATLE